MRASPARHSHADAAPVPSVEIRPAASEDAARIRDLTRAAYAKWVALIGREPLPMQADYDRAVREHAIDLLTVDGALAGLIETIVRPDHLWIENVAVAPDWQGRGYGRLLLAHAETRAAEAERGEIRLMTNAAFAANLALYAKLGYAIDRTEPFRGGTAVHHEQAYRSRVAFWRIDTLVRRRRVSKDAGPIGGCWSALRGRLAGLVGSGSCSAPQATRLRLARSPPRFRCIVRQYQSTNCMTPPS